MSRLRAENVRSEVADITGIVNSPVKVFFSTKTLEGSAPPPLPSKFLLGGLVCVGNQFADVKAQRCNQYFI